MSCEHTCTITQHYNTIQCFIVTAMKTHGNKADLVYLYVLWQVAFCVLNLLVCEAVLSMFVYKLPYGYVHKILVRLEAPGIDITW